MESVGRLEANVTYVYERNDDVIYARRIGDPPNQRFEIGRDYDSRSLSIEEAKLWGDIHRAARKNPALQDALDRVKLIHALSKQEDTVLHHPV